MEAKLKLKIDFINIHYNNDVKKSIKSYGVSIDIYDADTRYIDNIEGDNMYYSSIQNYRISPSTTNPIFSILDGIPLSKPNEKKINISHVWDNDDDRKKYLKRLYLTLKDWSNRWWGFTYDTPSNIIFNNNTWVVQCGIKYNGSMRYLKQQVESM